MCKYSAIVIAGPVVLLALLICGPVLADDVATDGVETWRSLDEEFRQAMVEEISARRGLEARDQNPDWLIQSAEDIREALRVSCEIAGDVCAEPIGEGEDLDEVPGYTVEQGFANGEAIRRVKSGLDKQ